MALSLVPVSHGNTHITTFSPIAGASLIPIAPPGHYLPSFSYIFPTTFMQFCFSEENPALKSVNLSASLGYRLCCVVVISVSINNRYECNCCMGVAGLLLF